MSPLYHTAINAAINAGLEILKIYDTDDFQVELKSDNSPLTLADRNAHNIIVSYLKDTGIPILSEEGKNIPFNERKNWDQFWLVDPLDGTKEFVKRNGEFTVNIALIKHSKPVLGVIYVPVTDVLYFGSVDDGANRVEHVSKLKSESSWNQEAIQLPLRRKDAEYRVVASRSHMNTETVDFVNKLQGKHSNVKIVSKGSSLKLCLIAEGEADIYPRFGPTSEWDTAAGHAIVLASDGKVVLAEDETKELVYNKENILNPYFIASRNNTK